MPIIFFGHLDGVAVLGVQSGDESVGLTGFHHHHAEVVALEHLVVGLFVGDAFAGALFGKDTCVTFAAFRFVGMAQVYDFNAFEAEVEFFCQLLDSFVIAQMMGWQIPSALASTAAFSILG